MDYFDIDSIFELVEKNKKIIRDEMDTITFENDKLSRESDKLLQILEYSPKKRMLERDIIKSIPIIKLNPPPEEKNQKNAKNTKHSKLPSTPNIDSFVKSEKAPNQENNEIAKDILNSIIDDAVEKSENKEREEEALMDNENIVSDSDDNIDLNEELLKVLENRYKLQTTAVYECKSLDTICKLLKYMPKKDNKMLKTMIYKMKNKYYFSNSCLKNTSLFCEYNVCETYISASYIKEHGRRINNFAVLLSL